MDPGQILVKHGLLDDESVARASAAQSNGERIDQKAVEMGLVSEVDALRAVG